MIIRHVAWSGIERPHASQVGYTNARSNFLAPQYSGRRHLNRFKVLNELLASPPLLKVTTCSIHAGPQQLISSCSNFISLWQSIVYRGIVSNLEAGQKCVVLFCLCIVSLHAYVCTCACIGVFACVRGQGIHPHLLSALCKLNNTKKTEECPSIFDWNHVSSFSIRYCLLDHVPGHHSWMTSCCLLDHVPGHHSWITSCCLLSRRWWFPRTLHAYINTLK